MKKLIALIFAALATIAGAQTVAPADLPFNLPPPDGNFRVPSGWSDLTITSVNAAGPNVPAICVRATAPVHVATVTGMSPNGPFSYTICQNDTGMVGWWRINPQSTAPLADVIVPPPPAFIVAPNGTLPTRPAFTLTNGSREFGSYAAATVGAACDCSTKTVEGQITFCRINPPAETSILVASCVKAP